jgi:hypothetical protein
MSSKTKRRVSGTTPTTTNDNQANATLSRRFSTSTEFNPDYTQIKIGLKRIGVLAASFITILVVLSFFLK